MGHDKLWVPPTSSAHRHQVNEEGHRALQNGGEARCLECGLIFKVSGQKVINLPG